MTVSRAEVIDAARALVGTPFVHQGRTLAGLDCAGLIIYLAHALGLSSFDASGYRRLPAGVSGVKIEDICRREMRQIDVSEIGPADVGLILDGKRPRHLALFADYHGGGLSMIHAYEPTRQVAEVRFSEDWRARLFEAYSLPGVL